jgi:hypothetical protein
MIQDRKILHLIEVFDDVFDEFEDVVVDHPAQLSHPVEDSAPLDSVLDAATTLCLPLNQRIDARLCMSCDHFIGCKRNEDGSLVLHCWTHQKRERLARGTQQMPVPVKLD